jgi:hypothetical protein
VSIPTYHMHVKRIDIRYDAHGNAIRKEWDFEVTMRINGCRDELCVTEKGSRRATRWGNLLDRLNFDAACSVRARKSIGVAHTHTHTSTLSPGMRFCGAVPWEFGRVRIYCRG